MNNEEVKIICLTPVKNESWILDNFLRCTSSWADKIIIADQNSSDNSREIAAKFPKVILIKNNGKDYNEAERKTILLNEARKIPGEKILIALDADEFFTAESPNKEEWEKIKKLKKGTVIKFDWLNILPEQGIYWPVPNKTAFGFVDDGSVFTGLEIHSDRVPMLKNSPVFFPEKIKVMHFQYAEWKRMESKHYWYQCWEKINHPQRNPIDVYRQYHHMNMVRKNQYQKILASWFLDYEKQGVNLKKINKEKEYWWDREIAELLKKYGAKFFSPVAIWDKDWDTINDPRGVWQKLLHYYLKKTQKYSNRRPIIFIDKMLNKILTKPNKC